MEFRFDVCELFKNAEIVEITNNLLPYGFHNSGEKRILWDTQSKITQIINALGEASAAAQNLTKPITTASRLRNSEHKIYILIDQDIDHELNGQNVTGAVIGMLKIGTKNLYIFDRMGHHYQISSTLCILDFYVHESKQRSGFGKKLFEFMLQKENIDPVKIAIDRPSEKFLNFLKKHYGLTNPIKQMNNFVVFDGFFSTLPSSESVITNNGSDDAVTNYRKGKGIDISNNKLSSEGLSNQTNYNYGRYNVAHRPHCSMGEIIHNDSSISKYNVDRPIKNDNRTKENHQQIIDRPHSLFDAIELEQSGKLSANKQGEKAVVGVGMVEDNNSGKNDMVENSCDNPSANISEKDSKNNGIDTINGNNGGNSPSPHCISPVFGEVAAGITTPGRSTPGLTEQGYFDLKFFHNKLW